MEPGINFPFSAEIQQRHHQSPVSFFFLQFFHLNSMSCFAVCVKNEFCTGVMMRQSQIFKGKSNVWKSESHLIRSYAADYCADSTQQSLRHLIRSPAPSPHVRCTQSQQSENTSALRMNMCVVMFNYYRQPSQDQNSSRFSLVHPKSVTVIPTNY